MKMMQKSLLVLGAFATTALNVYAVSNIDVKVGGRVDPGSCIPELAGGGTFNYGTLGSSDVENTAYTVLPERLFDLTITCTSKSKVAIKIKNGRPDSTAGNTENSDTGFARSPAGVSLFNSTGYVGVAGLGKSNGVKVGGYAMRIYAAGAIADNKPVATIWADSSAGNTPSWSNIPVWFGLLPSDVAGVQGASWAVAGSTTPVAFSTLSAQLGIQVYLNQGSAFDWKNKIQLDGLSTLELSYLP